jgi:hypothetical protein
MTELSAFTFSGDQKNSEPVTLQTSTIEAKFSGKALGISGTILCSGFLPKCT